MKKSELIKKQLDALESKIETAFAKFMESTSSEDQQSWKTLNDTYTDLEESYQEALQEETLDERDHETDPSKEQKETTRGEKKGNLTEETKKWLKDFREAIALGGRFTCTMPSEISKQIQYKKAEIAKIKNLCTIHNAGGEYTVVIEGDDVTVDYVAEGATISASDVKPKALKLAALKFAAIGKFTTEMAADASVDMIDYIVNVFAKALARKEDHEILFGTGTSSNTGTVRGVAATGTAAAVINAASATTVTFEEIQKLITKIGAYRASGTLVISSAVEALLYTFKDEKGNPYFNPLAPIPSIRGCKVVVSDQMPALTTKNVAAIAGDFSYYHICDRESMNVQVLNEKYADEGKIGVRIEERWDGDFVGEAFACLKLA